MEVSIQAKNAPGVCAQAAKATGTLSLQKVLDMKDAGVEVESFVSEDMRLQMYTKEVRSSAVSPSHPVTLPAPRLQLAEHMKVTSESALLTSAAANKQKYRGQNCKKRHVCREEIWSIIGYLRQGKVVIRRPYAEQLDMQEILRRCCRLM